MGVYLRQEGKGGREGRTEGCEEIDIQTHSERASKRKREIERASDRMSVQVCAREITSERAREMTHVFLAIATKSRPV